MAIVDTQKKKTKFEPIVIEIDGKTVEICSCGQTTNEDRTCSDAHNILNAQMDATTESAGDEAEGKKMTLEEVLNKINEELQNGGHACACGGQCGCNH